MSQSRGLNPDQHLVANHLDGAIQVIAGAGSGKTTTLIHRTANIMKERALPSEILLVTFTRKAAGEIKNRLADMMGEKQGNLLTAGTFHSICLQKILKRHADEDFLANFGLKAHWEGMDANDQNRLMRQTFREMTDGDMDYCKRAEIRPKNFEAFMTFTRSMGIHHGQYQNEKRRVIESNDREHPLYRINDRLSSDGIENIGEFEDVALRFMARYEQLCRSANAVDFDDILVLSDQLLSSRPGVAADLAKEWRYLMLDEYQDTNMVQMRIMDAIAKHHHNICVVGDDQQSIYAFRGSNIEVIRGFQKRYPNATLYDLNDNYRSTSEILYAGNQIAEAMPNRLSQKSLRSPLQKHGGLPETRLFRTDLDEAEWVSGDIQRRLLGGESPENIAILYRNRAMKQTLEKTLLDNDVAYEVANDTSFFERKEVQDAIALVRFTFRPWSALSAMRFLEGANLPIKSDAVRNNAERKGVSPHRYLTEFAAPARDVLGDATMDTEDQKRTRFHNHTNTFANNVRRIASMDKSGREANKKSLLKQSEAVEALFSEIMNRIENGRYERNAIRKKDISDCGVAARKTTKGLKKDVVDWEACVESANTCHQKLKRSIMKSNEVRLFLDTTEAIVDTAAICDMEGVSIDTVRKLPSNLRNAMASLWEHYMASSLEKYAGSQLAGDGDKDSLGGRLGNVEYIMDRFSTRLASAIDSAENSELSFSEVVDVAIDDLVMLVEHSPEESINTNVKMMTLHAAKGLEFNSVYIIGAAEEVMPGANQRGSHETVEEERRLFYVGVTRARENLVVTCPYLRRNFKGESMRTTPSQFIGLMGDAAVHHEPHSNLSDRKKKSPSMAV